MKKEITELIEIVKDYMPKDLVMWAYVEYDHIIKYI